MKRLTITFILFDLPVIMAFAHAGPINRWKHVIYCSTEIAILVSIAFFLVWGFAHIDGVFGECFRKIYPITKTFYCLLWILLVIDLMSPWPMYFGFLLSPTLIYLFVRNQKDRRDSFDYPKLRLGTRIILWLYRSTFFRWLVLTTLFFYSEYLKNDFASHISKQDVWLRVFRDFIYNGTHIDSIYLLLIPIIHALHILYCHITSKRNK